MSYRDRARLRKAQVHPRRGEEQGRVEESGKQQSHTNDAVRLPDIDSGNRERKGRRPARDVNDNERAPNGDVTPVRERFRNRQEPEAENPDRGRRGRTNTTKKVTFYRNGDKHFQGAKFIITPQRYRSFDTLVGDLSKTIALPYGVRHVFSPGGTSIDEISQLEDGRIYVCSSGDHLIKHVDYGGVKAREKRQSDSDHNADGLSDASSVTTNSSSNKSTHRLEIKNGGVKPRVITVISNSDKNNKCKILLNRKTVKNYESVLNDISEMLQPRDGPVSSLYTLQGAKIGGLSELFRGDDIFHAVSSDQSFKRNLSNPSSHSSNGNPSPSPQRKLQRSRKKLRKESTGLGQGVVINVRGQKMTYYPPSEFDPYTIEDRPVSPPKSKLQLNWVYGYRGKDTYGNLHVLPSGEVLYFVSTVAVIYNRSTNNQRHYTGHADDIKCMAVHPNQWYIATGQASGLSLDQNELSHVRIWDAETLISLAVLSLEDYGLAITCLSFSCEDNGKQLVCVDSSDEDYRLTVWEWEDRSIIAQSKSLTNAVLAAEYDPEDSRTIVSCGKEHIYFWRLHNGRLERKSGFFEKYDVPRFLTCLEFAPSGDVITGDSDGSITVWGKVSKKIKFVVRNAHEKSILSLRLLDNGTLLSAGGVDGKLLSWDANKYFNTPLQEAQLDDMYGGITAIEPVTSNHGDNVTLLLGTTSNNVAEGSFRTHFKLAVQSQKEDILALAVHPEEQLFISASLDKTLTLWRADSHKVMWNVAVEFPIKSAAFYVSGNVIALGTTAGRWIVLNGETGMHIASFQDGTEPLSDLEYSRDGEHIAIASCDGNIYVHAVYDEGFTYRRVGTCSSHAEPIMFLDWSLDGCFIQSISTDYEHIVWEIGAFQKEESQNIIRDTEWSTRNVMLGYDVAGVWPSQSDSGNLVCSCDLSWSRDLFALGDELGYIRLFQYPCSQSSAHFHQYRGHSSSVTRLLFLASDNHVITTGSRDACVLEWAVQGKLGTLPEEEEGEGLAEDSQDEEYMEINHYQSESDEYEPTGADRGRRGPTGPREERFSDEEDDYYHDDVDRSQRNERNGAGKPARRRDLHREPPFRGKHDARPKPHEDSYTGGYNRRRLVGATSRDSRATEPQTRVRDSNSPEYYGEGRGNRAAPPARGGPNDRYQRRGGQDKEGRMRR